MQTNTNTTLIPTVLSIAYNEREAQLEILQHAFTEVLGSTELREADPPMLDVLHSLNERFSNLLKHS